MRYLHPVRTYDLVQASPIVWISQGKHSAFVFDVKAMQTGFVCFFVAAARGHLAPKLTFDQGSGFDELTAFSLKVFPFVFYHVALDKLRDVEQIRFGPSSGAATFRFLPLLIHNAILVAILHYLFNLRYQKIGFLAADSAGRVGLLPWIKSNVARVLLFFRDVSSGSGMRVQEGSVDVLAMLKVFSSLEAATIQTKMDALLMRKTDHPLISFVSPTYNTSTTYLSDLIQSFTTQKAAYAELILSDDGSTRRDTLDRLAATSAEAGVTLVLNTENAGIAAATNSGIAAARGEWIAFIDHDDLFIPGAIAMIAQAIRDNPQADFFYTDEIIADAALNPSGAICKPAFDSVLLSGINYINHFSIFRRKRLDAIGGLRTDREGSQDYDLLLRYLTDSKPGSTIHIPFLAYVWRRQKQTYSSIHVERSKQNARLALESVYNTAQRKVEICPALDPNLHRVQFEVRAQPKVSVVIPNKDSFDLVTRIIADLKTRTNYSNLEIVIVDNGTTDAKVLSFYRTCQNDPSLIVDIVEAPFNFAHMCNRGAALARGDLLLFLNNDVEVRAEGWLTEMVSCLAFSSVGIVGAKLLYPNGLNQHVGVIVGLGGAAGHWHVGMPADEFGPMSRLAVRQTMSAVTGACMLVTRVCFETLSGFDADTFPIAYNDVDLCLRARTAGFRTVWTPFAELIHHESISRGSDESGLNNARLQRDMARLRERHGTDSYLDDAYSPFYDARYAQPHLIVPKTLPRPRPNAFS